MKKSWATGFTVALRSGVASVVLCMGATAAFSQDVATGEAAKESADDDIVVTGIRESLRTAIGEKRNSNKFVDVINAEDIGKLPDNSVADSLQRVTGVQIIADIGASREVLTGQTVTIRGLGAISFLNGRTLLSGETTRDLDFRTLASEGFGSLVISKSTSADTIEGGLGGVIDLNTQRSKKTKGTVVSISAKGEYLEYADTLNPVLSGFISTSTLEDRLTLQLSASYQKLRTRQDQFSARGGWVVQNGYTGSGFDYDSNGTADAIVPSDLRINYGGDVQERLGLLGSIEFEATPELTLRLDGVYSRYNRDFKNGVLRIANFGAGNVVPGTLVLDSTGTAVAGTFNNQLIQADGRLEIDNVKSSQIGFNAQWSRDRLDISGDISYSRGGSDGRQLINRYQTLTPRQVAYDFRAGILPDITIANTDLNNRSDFRVDLTFNEIDDYDNEEWSGRLDAKYKLDGLLSAIAIGMRFSDTTFSRRAFTQNQQAGNTANRVVFDAAGNRIPASNPALDPLFQGFPVQGGVFGGIAGNFPRTWLYTSYPGGSISGPGEYGDIYGLDAAGRTESLLNRADIGEKTLAGYIRGDFEGDRFRGNIGLRVVRTKVSSVAFQALPGGGNGFVKETNDYVDFLPSANIAYDLTPDLLLRVAAARVMRRPDLAQLKSNLNVQLSDLTASAGNIALKPFRANQADAGLEWYLGADGLIAGTVFYKRVTNFTTVTTERDVDIGFVGLDGGTLFTVTRPINAGSANIKGFEVNVQQALAFLPGALSYLGVQANYTYSDANAFPGLSKHVYNLIGYYDDGRLSARAAYNWRSRYSSVGDGSNGLSFLGVTEFVAGRGQLDASITYQITPNFTLVAEGLNLNNAAFRRYNGTEIRLRDYRIGGRRYTVGARTRF